jgi:hypothetical protein
MLFHSFSAQGHVLEGNGSAEPPRLVPKRYINTAQGNTLDGWSWPFGAALPATLGNTDALPTLAANESNQDRLGIGYLESRNAHRVSIRASHHHLTRRLYINTASEQAPMVFTH